MGSLNLPNGETSKRRVVSEGLNTHGLGGNHLDDSGITRLDEFLLLMSVIDGVQR